MSFITVSKKAYRQVEILEKENSDHEISMARSELESTADKALAISSMLQSKSDIGNPLEAWVQSKITKAKDYITSVHDYLKYTPGMNESFDLEENTFEKIYQMQQDGKSTEDIAKELKLNPALVKKVLGEQIELKEFTDAMLTALKKEYEPLKGKTITTAQYQQLKNILFKLQDADLEKLQKQNIPFASTGAGSILRVRKSPVKITSVKVPGLEGMAEEKIPQDYLDYLRTIVYKKVDFYEIPPKHIIQHWKDEPNKDRFKGKIIDYKEGVELQEKPSIKQYVVFHSDNSPTKHKEFKAYDETELNKQIGEFLKQNPGYKVYGKSPSQSVKEAVDMSKVIKYKMISIKGDQKEITIDREDLEKHLKLGYVIKEPLTEEPKNPYAIGMAAAMKATGDTPPLKKSTITKAHKIADKVKEEEVNKTNPKSDEKRTIDMTDGSAHVRFPKDDTKAMEFYKSKGYKVTTKYEETELEEACWTGYKKVGMKKKGDRMVPNCVPEGYVTESGDIVEFVELNEGQFKEIDTRKGDLKLAKDKKQNLKDKYNAIMAGQATGDENAIADQIQKLEMSIKKQEQELIDIMKKQRETKKEEVSKEKETEFHKKLDTLVHKTFGKRKDEKMPVKESTSRNINEGARALVEAIAALQNKADKSGMPYSILKQVYDRGMAAWKGGHRPGAGQHQWAFARVNSFVTKSSGTWGGADSDLAKKVKGKE